MLKDVIDILKDISLRHKGVRSFRYQGDDYNNAQNNYPGYQVYVDDISHLVVNFKLEEGLWFTSNGSSKGKAICSVLFATKSLLLCLIDIK